MEAYKMTCKNCGYVRYWSGFKTGLGKSPEQLEKMREDNTTCVNCLYDQNEAELDHESQTGQEMDESSKFAANIIKSLLGG